MSDTLTITLTDRQPVKIVKDEWPIIASAHAHDGGQHESQANSEWKIKVRRHEDGRAIVYGTYSSQFIGREGYRGGSLIENDEFGVTNYASVVECINEEGDAMKKDSLAADCIADLPPETI